MSSDLDFFDDLIESEKPKGQVDAKFKPKLRPKNAKAPSVPSQTSKDAMQTSVLLSQTSKDAEQPSIPSLSSKEAMQPIPVAPESDASYTSVSLWLDEKTLQPCGAASSAPAAFHHLVSHEHVDQPDASVSESLPLKDCRTESVHHYHEKSVQEKDVDILFNLDDSEGLRTPGSISPAMQDGCEKPKGVPSSKDKAQEKLHLNEKSATHLEVSQDTMDDHEGSKKLQSDHHEPEIMAVGNDSDMRPCGRLSHPGGASGVKEGKPDFAWPNLYPAAGSKGSSEFNVLQGSLGCLESSADAEPFHSADKEAEEDNDQATNMFFNMESLGNDIDNELNSGVDQSVKATYLTNVSADENQPSIIDDSFPSSCVNEKISVSFGDEDMMVFSGFQSANELSLDTAAVTEMDKSHSESMPLRGKKKGKSVSFILPDASEPASLGGSFSETTEPCFSDMMTDACIEQPLNPLSLDGNKDHQMDHLVLEEETSENVSLEFDEVVSKQNTKTGKFRPKPRTRINKTKLNASAANTGSMDLSSQQDSQIGAPVYSDVHSSETTKDNPVNPSISLEEEFGFEIQLQDVQERNQGTEEVITAPELGKSTRILRKRADKSSACAEVATDDLESIFEMNEVQNDDDYQDADEPKKGRGQKKSMLKTSESEKPVRRRKRTVEEPDSTAEKPPKKKLPHGTQRKRRQVSKTLLEKPEEEINPRQLPIKDLILLAEAKERTTNKTGGGLFGNTFSSQSNNSFFNDDETNFFGEDEEQNCEDDEEQNCEDDEEQNYEDDEGTYRIQKTKKKLNYHSYMNKPRTTRWSKTETDLLYQAISEFGTNFSMIEQLFPNRTRHQVKLKFKNEERKNPLLVHDALNTRSKDHSLFKLVIEQMQINSEQNPIQDTQDPTSTSHDACNENEEEQVEPHKEAGEDVQNQQKEMDVKKDEPDDSTNLNEDENVFIWDDDDDGGIFPDDVEKKDSWEF